MKHALALIALAAACAAPLPAAAQRVTEINFYYPVAVGGPVTKTIDQMAADFGKENPDIKVNPVYSGTYQESIVKALTATKSGKPPQLAVLLSTDMFSLIDEDAIVPIDDIAKSADDRKWLDGFYKSFMMNSQTGGKTWGIPFQRSTIVLYWNKEAFKEAGLDPDKRPANWDQMVEFAKKLTKRDAGGNVTQWGVKIPSSGFPYWLFQGLTTPNGVELMNDAGTETYFDKPEVIEALQYWVDLSAKHKVMPAGVIEWGTTPKDFFEKKAAMIWTTTGNLTNIRTNAGFPFGVAMLPAKKRRGSPTGGGNFYIFAKTTPAEQQAALKFAKWATAPQRAAQWSIATGYVAVTAGGVGHAGDEEVRAGRAAGAGRARPAAALGRRAVDARQPARDDGAEQRPAGGAHRVEDPGRRDARRAARGDAHPAGLQEVEPVILSRRRRISASGDAILRCAQDDKARRRHALAAAAAGVGAARRLHALAGRGHRLAQLHVDAEEVAAVALRRPRELPGDGAGRGVLAVALEQRVLRRGDGADLDRAGDRDGALGQQPHGRAHLPAHGLLHADGAADDRGGQHLALLLHAAVRAARADHARPRLRQPQLARRPRHRARRVIAVAVWKEAGFFMIFYLAALQSIPPSLAEAAALEGASRWHYFRRVLFPLLMPTTLFVLVNALINSVRLVDHIFVMTRGGPDNATSLLLFHIYQVGFSFWDTGYAAALTVVVLLALALVAFVQFRFLDRRTHYQ